MGIFKHIKEKIQGKLPAGVRRSARWPHVRAEHLKQHPACALCGGKNKLEVHHIVPFHVNPDRELDPNNLITLCESKKGGINCHLAVGHLGSYHRYNPDVAVDAEAWGKKFRN